MSVLQLSLYAICALLALAAYWLHKHLSYWQNLGILCDRPHYLYGNLRGMGKTRSFGEITLDYYRKFRGTGPFCGFYWGLRHAVFVLDTSLAKAILIKDFNKFTNRGFYSNPEDDPLTGNLFALDGHKWRTMRNKLSPTFTSGKMKQMFATITQVGAELVKVVDDALQTAAGRGDDPTLEMRDLLARFTVDVIGSCAFGIDCNSLRNPDDPFREMGRRAFTEQRYGMLAMALILLFPNLCRRLHVKLVPDHITEFYMRIVRDNIEYREKNNVKRNDFFDMLLELKNNKMLKAADGSTMANITVEELAAQAFVFMVAGYETSSATMAFALYELAQHEAVQERARREVCAVLERHEGGGEFTYECMSEMVYLNQVLSETLRKHTIIPFLARECSEDYPVPGHPQYVIKRGMIVVIPVAGIHFDEDYYPQPEQFNPDNFAPEKVAERDPIRWLPFGDGPRNCIGLRFALMEARVGLALLLKNYKFSVCERTPMPLRFRKDAFLKMAADDIYLRVEKL